MTDPLQWFASLNFHRKKWAYIWMLVSWVPWLRHLNPCLLFSCCWQCPKKMCMAFGDQFHLMCPAETFKFLSRCNLSHGEHQGTSRNLGSCLSLRSRWGALLGSDACDVEGPQHPTRHSQQFPVRIIWGPQIGHFAYSTIILCNIIYIYSTICFRDQIRTHSNLTAMGRKCTCWSVDPFPLYIYIAKPRSPFK